VSLGVLEMVGMDMTCKNIWKHIGKTDDCDPLFFEGLGQPIHLALHQ